MEVQRRLWKDWVCCGRELQRAEADESVWRHVATAEEELNCMLLQQEQQWEEMELRHKEKIAQID
jgi:hypothetical protein